MSTSQQVYRKALEMSNNRPYVLDSNDVVKYIDNARPVRIYRNLHKKCLSVQQDGLVKCHTNSIVLFNFKTIVSKAGQLRVRSQKKKSVHAFISGYILDSPLLMSDFANQNSAVELYYNPYNTDFWTVKETGEFVYGGGLVYIDTKRVSAYNCNMELIKAA